MVLKFGVLLYLPPLPRRENLLCLCCMFNHIQQNFPYLQFKILSPKDNQVHVSLSQFSNYLSHSSLHLPTVTPFIEKLMCERVGTGHQWKRDKSGHSSFRHAAALRLQGPPKAENLRLCSLRGIWCWPFCAGTLEGPRYPAEPSNVPYLLITFIETHLTPGP